MSRAWVPWRNAPFILLVALVCGFAPQARAQDPPPRIGPIVVDVHGSVPKFGAESDLALSRGLVEPQLPGTGLGIDVAAHVYVYRWRAITVGLGGRVMAARGHTGSSVGDGLAPLSGVTERLLVAAPELSLNFGTGDGWSYLSGGLGPGVWEVVADGAQATAADRERLRFVHYGAGARWFVRRHLAFAVDVRFYQNDPGAPTPNRPGTPRSSNVVIGAGVSVR